MSKPIQLLQQKTDSLEEKVQKGAANTAGIGKTIHLAGIESDVTDLYFTRIADHLYNLSGTIKINQDVEEGSSFLVEIYPTNLESDIECFNNGSGEDIIAGHCVGYQHLQKDPFEIAMTMLYTGYPPKHVINLEVSNVANMSACTIHFNCTFFTLHTITATESS